MATGVLLPLWGEYTIGFYAKYAAWGGEDNRDRRYDVNTLFAGVDLGPVIFMFL